MPKVGIFHYDMTEKEPNDIQPAPPSRRNRRVLLFGAAAIILLTLAGIGILHYQYTSRMDDIHRSGRQFSDLQYAGTDYTPPAEGMEEETAEDTAYDDEEDARPVFSRPEIPADTAAPTPPAEVSTDEPADSSIKGGAGHLTLRGHIDADVMLFVLEEDESGLLKGQFYNQSTNKAVSVEGRHQGRKILLHSTNQGNWDFTIIEEGGHYKGVATDGQFTYRLTLH